MLTKLAQDKILLFWDEIKESIIQCIPSFGEKSQRALNVLLESLLSNKVQAWVMYEEKDDKKILHAVIVTSFYYDIGTETKSLLIYAAYGYKYIVDEMWKDSVDTLKTFAKANDCFRVLAFSSVPRVIQVARMMGAKTDEVLLSLEV